MRGTRVFKMSLKKYMKDVDMKKVFPTLNHVQQVFVKKVERENYARATSVRQMRKSNLRTGVGLGAFVLGTYVYTMYAIRQEKVEEFDDEPEPAKSTVAS